MELLVGRLSLVSRLPQYLVPESAGAIQDYFRIQSNILDHSNVYGSGGARPVDLIVRHFDVGLRRGVK